MYINSISNNYIKKFFIIICIVFFTYNNSFADPIDYGKVLTGEKFEGQAHAPITIILYASFSCPHCGEFHNKIAPLLKADYIDKGKVKYVERLVAFDKPAFLGAALVGCVPENIREKMIDVLFKKQQSWLLAKNYEKELKNIAKIAGINEEKFTSCINNKEFEESFLERQQGAIKQFNLNATPILIINGKRFENGLGYYTIKEEIEKNLKLFKN